jgi:hypothetical protein
VGYPEWGDTPPDTRRQPHPAWPDSPWHVAANPDPRPVEPETGSWSTRQGRWTPHQRGGDRPHHSDRPEYGDRPHHGDRPEYGDRPDYDIGRFDDTGELPHRPPPGEGRVIDHDEWSADRGRRRRPLGPEWGTQAGRQNQDPWLAYLRGGGRHGAADRRRSFEGREVPDRFNDPGAAGFAAGGLTSSAPLPRSAPPGERRAAGLPRNAPPAPRPTPPPAPAWPAPSRTPGPGPSRTPGPGPSRTPGPAPAPAWPPPRGRRDTGEYPAVRRSPARDPALDFSGDPVLDRRLDRAVRRPPEPEPPEGWEDDWADEDEESDDAGGFMSAILATFAWYAIPAAGFVLWTRLLSTQSRPGCLDPTGAPCLSPRATAWQAFTDNLPRLALALVLSTLVALLIRWLTVGWRAVTIGFAGSVVGAGAATVLFSVLVKTAGS